MDTPVALAIFNRPQQLREVFDAVRRAQPRRLFVIADGPREDRPGEKDLCAQARAITEQVDWDCRVERNYAQTNMGCGRRLSSGYDWLFSQVDRAIIIEDDCVADPSFFPFCEQMLERYADDERVMHITGRSIYADPPPRPYSYYFSHQLDCWGWATWARAWKHYDFNISLWPQVRDERWLKGLLRDPRAVRFFMQLFDRIHGDIATWTTWAHQWNFACFAQHGLAIRSYNNLVKYVGFDDATHAYMWGDDKEADLPVKPLEFPLKHPPCPMMDPEADELNYDRIFSGLQRKQRIERMKRPLRMVKSAVRSALSINGGGKG